MYFYSSLSFFCSDFTETMYPVNVENDSVGSIFIGMKGVQRMSLKVQFYVSMHFT